MRKLFWLWVGLESLERMPDLALLLDIFDWVCLLIVDLPLRCRVLVAPERIPPTRLR